MHKIRDFLKNNTELILKFTYLPTNDIVEKRISGVGGFSKKFRVGHGKCLCWLTRWVDGVKKGQKRAYVILEWSLTYVPFNETLKFFQAK